MEGCGCPPPPFRPFLMSWTLFLVVLLGGAAVLSALTLAAKRWADDRVAQATAVMQAQRQRSLQAREAALAQAQPPPPLEEPLLGLDQSSAEASAGAAAQVQGGPHIGAAPGEPGRPHISWDPAPPRPTDPFADLNPVRQARPSSGR